MQLPILRGGSQGKLVAGDRPGQVSLAEVRPLVRELGLGADQRDAAVPTAVPQSCRDRVAGRAAPDDYCLRSNARNLRSDQAR